MLRTARRLDASLAGAPLAVADLRWGHVDGERLHCACTLAVVAVGKHLLHRLDNGLTLHTHLRMDGRWQTLPVSAVTPAQRRAPGLRALLATQTTAALGWHLGLVEIVRTRDEADVVGHLGPDLLGGDWNEALALSNLMSAPERPIAEALLDQRNLAGLGTIFTSEPLFMQQIHPWTRVGALPADRIRALVRRGQELLQVSMTYGHPCSTGHRREPMYVFGRKGRPCRRCGTTLRHITVGEPPRERVLTYCSRCQPEA